jgi:VanZ family protein
MFSSIPASGLPEMPSDTWLFWSHRFAHLFEYSVLGVLAARAGLVVRENKSLKTFFVFTGVILCAAVFDEWHQSFVSGRTAALIDVIFDILSGAGGVMAYQLWIYRPKKK